MIHANEIILVYGHSYTGVASLRADLVRLE